MLHDSFQTVTALLEVIFEIAYVAEAVFQGGGFGKRWIDSEVAICAQSASFATDDSALDVFALEKQLT